MQVLVVVLTVADAKAWRFSASFHLTLNGGESTSGDTDRTQAILLRERGL